jgi:hypothetical protein
MLYLPMTHVFQSKTYSDDTQSSALKMFLDLGHFATGIRSDLHPPDTTHIAYEAPCTLNTRLEAARMRMTR